MTDTLTRDEKVAAAKAVGRGCANWNHFLAPIPHDKGEALEMLEEWARQGKDGRRYDVEGDGWDTHVALFVRQAHVAGVTASDLPTAAVRAINRWAEQRTEQANRSAAAPAPWSDTEPAPPPPQPDPLVALWQEVAAARPDPPVVDPARRVVGRLYDDGTYDLEDAP